MSLWPILLRVLLGVALVLNGATAAVAAMHLAGNASAASTQSSVTEGSAVASESTPCHQVEQPLEPTPLKGLAAAQQQIPDAPPHADPDCCESGTCECAWIHVAPLDYLGNSLRPMVGDGSRSARWLAVGHAAPALPHLIRPPIG